ncbi:hypothetical protein POM88_007036 [Heracleum sosnowskyi]|uniref:Uncharacterized protein n=1 Tax=Heracleum sosnowskyi TaxID=360622 RepID=A0AAD8N757_9APIA|nr:hypothetical protein POM88_007036 [Heracleum sosnowskyi]
MIDRFLPSTKAMNYEVPQYSPRKQHVVQEQTRPILKVVNRDKSSLWYGPNVDYEEEESNNGDDDYDVHGDLPAKSCGLNTLLGMHGKMRRKLSTGSRAHEISSSAGSCRKNVNEIFNILRDTKATVFEQRLVRDLHFSKLSYIALRRPRP